MKNNYGLYLKIGNKEMENINDVVYKAKKNNEDYTEVFIDYLGIKKSLTLDDFLKRLGIIK